jgi:hypothetical protein
MDNNDAFKLANDIVMSFVENQDIPPGGTGGSAESHGEKTAQFIAAMHRTLHEYFRQVVDR